MQRTRSRAPNPSAAIRMVGVSAVGRVVERDDQGQARVGGAELGRQPVHLLLIEMAPLRNVAVEAGGSAGFRAQKFAIHVSSGARLGSSLVSPSWFPGMLRNGTG